MTNNITSFNKLLDLGQKHEKLAEVRSKYSAPKGKERSKVPDLAYDDKTVKAKIAAVTETVTASVDTSQAEEVLENTPTRGKRKPKGRGKQAKTEELAALSTPGDQNQQAQQRQQQGSQQQRQTQQQRVSQQQQPRSQPQQQTQPIMQPMASQPYPWFPNTFPDPNYFAQMMQQWNHGSIPSMQFSRSQNNNQNNSQNNSQDNTRRPKSNKPRFPAHCVLCQDTNHRTLQCPQLNKRDICLLCGKIGVRYTNCSCPVATQYRAGNAQLGTGQAPTTSS